LEVEVGATATGAKRGVAFALAEGMLTPNWLAAVTT
jgi:hypothetical protein